MYQSVMTALPAAYTYTECDQIQEPQQLSETVLENIRRFKELRYVARPSVTIAALGLCRAGTLQSTSALQGLCRAGSRLTVRGEEELEMATAAVVSFCCLAVDATAAPRACTANARSSRCNKVLCMQPPVFLQQPSSSCPLPQCQLCAKASEGSEVIG